MSLRCAECSTKVPNAAAEACCKCGKLLADPDAVYDDGSEHRTFVAVGLGFLFAVVASFLIAVAIGFDPNVPGDPGPYERGVLVGKTWTAITPICLILGGIAGAAIATAITRRVASRRG
ncbi:MAG TPA: hypothetical protein VGK19_12300 [Capsulimonadaceae bacterium]|jgi:hypothetical protein